MLLINASNLYVGGGMQVGISVINELAADKAHFIAAVSRPVYIQLSDEAKKKALLLEKTPSGLLNFSTRKSLDNIVHSYDIDIVFTIFGPSYWTPKVKKHLVGFALPWLIYDTGQIYSKLSLKEKIKKQLLRFLQPYFFKKNADMLVTETSDVTSKVITLMQYNPKDVYTVSNTISEVFKVPSLHDENILKKLPVKQEGDIWLLTISHNYPHKNLNCIKELVKTLPANFKFITTLEKKFLNDIPDELQDRIITLGSVSISECPPLYKVSDAMFLPTLLECFSASYAEALYMETTILTSERSFARTICQDAAFYFDPLDNSSIATTILSAFDDDKRREEKIVLGKHYSMTIPDARQRAKKYMSILYGNKN